MERGNYAGTWRDGRCPSVFGEAPRNSDDTAVVPPMLRASKRTSALGEREENLSLALSFRSARHGHGKFA